MPKQVVLVVEDEPFIRLNAVEMIQAAGFEVIDVANADDAIVWLERRLDIAVVFTDIQMPGSMDGLKLAAAVRDRWPPIQIIATSGNVRATADDLPEGGFFLAKPYTANQLTVALRDACAP